MAAKFGERALARHQKDGPAWLENGSSRLTAVSNRTGEIGLASIKQLRREHCR
ncbi:hypothetical protein WOC76_15685 [Methylocystis sp. IM3]|uniref:hypothetical protein n=1 Tax=unclassified Methylocystis TaxID=2625913 RepID=UPI0030F9EA00